MPQLMYKELQATQYRYANTGPSLLSRLGSKIKSACASLFESKDVVTTTEKVPTLSTHTQTAVASKSISSEILPSLDLDLAFCKKMVSESSPLFATLTASVDRGLFTWKEARLFLPSMLSTGLDLSFLSGLSSAELCCLRDAIKENMLDTLFVLGRQLESVKYVASLHITGGLSLQEISDIFSLLSETNFSLKLVTSLHVEDFVCLKHALQLRKNKGVLDAYEIYSSLPDVVSKRCMHWLSVAAQETPYLVMTKSFARAIPDEAVLRRIAEFYITCSGETHNSEKDLSVAYAFLRTFIMVTTLIPLPSLSFLRLLVLWSQMSSTMQDYVRSVTFIDPAALIACCISMIRSVVSNRAMSFINFVTSSSESAFGELSKDNQNKILSFFSKKGIDVDSISKFKSWNKTLSILADIPNLTKPAAIRMLSTYALAQSFIRAFTLHLDPVAFIKESSLVPNNHTVHGILKFYREEKDYHSLCRDKRNTYSRLYKNVVEQEQKGIKEVPVKIEGKNVKVSSTYIAYRLYFELLKLKFAFLPNDDSPLVSSAYYDPLGHYVDMDLVSDVCSYLTSDSSFSFISSTKLQAKVLYKLKKIKDEKYEAYMQLFGEPTFSLVKKNPKFIFENG